MPLLDQLSAQLDRLAEWDPGPFPVVSLYLNLQADDKGRDNFEPFLRKELSDRIASLQPGVRVLFVSGHAENAIVHHGVLDADARFLGKPYTLDGLARKVRELLLSEPAEDARP